MKLIFVTESLDKIREFQNVVSPFISSNDLDEEIKQKLADLPEIQSISVEEVVKQKAISAFQILNSPLFVEDTGLYDLNLPNLFPGALVKWFLGSGLFNKIVGDEIFVETCIGFTKDGKKVDVFKGVIKGKIVTQRGLMGFGFDKFVEIELANGLKKTLGQLTLEDKTQISQRSQAIRAFNHFLVS